MGNSCYYGRNDDETLKQHADWDMGIARLLAVLLMILEHSGPGRPAPLRPVCDPRVLERFIREARDIENTMRVCSEDCRLSEALTVPYTSVNFDEWESKDNQEQEQEVGWGLQLLLQALSSARPAAQSADLQGLLDTSISNLQSVGHILRSLGTQEQVAGDGALPGGATWQVSTLPELFQVHTNFLRGKVRLLLGRAAPCRKDGS
ncbi:EPO protein, partial [Amia calva]|nr:EPO protein [Amia calva]